MNPRTTAGLAGAALVLFGLNVWGYDLWAPDEPRYGQVAREMIQTGDWWTLHINGEPYMEKPPLFFWSIAAASLPFGDVSAFTTRVPSILAGTVTVVLSVLLAARLFSPYVAFWAGIMMLSSWRIWWQARTAQIDMVLTAFMTIALYAFWRHTESPSRSWRIVFFAAIAAGFLAKGPVAVLFPFLLWVAYFWGRREERKRFPIVVGLLIASGLGILWLVTARVSVAGADAGSALGQDVFRQVIGRALLGVSKAQPPWYYFWQLPIDLLPWTLILPWTIVWAWRNRRNDSVRLLLAWIVPAFVVFSILVGKRQIYLLPIIPAIAIAVAGSLIPFFDTARTKYRVAAAGVWIVTLLAMAAVPFVVASQYPEYYSPWLLALTAAALFGVAITGYDAVAQRARRLHLCLAVPSMLLMAAAALVALPQLNNVKSAADICEPLRAMSRSGVDYRLYSFAFSREEFIFYAEHVHEPVLVDHIPGQPDTDIEAIEHVFLDVGVELLDALSQVPIESVETIGELEAQKLRAAALDYRDTIRAQSAERRKAFDMLESSAQTFAADFIEGSPAFTFVQTGDWPWLVAFAPEMATCELVANDRVGRGWVLLVANPAGSELLSGGAFREY
jgi:4-amino-4-deoxy-L-arabinose transferase-like glycosyltransferase